MRRLLFYIAALILFGIAYSQSEVSLSRQEATTHDDNADNSALGFDTLSSDFFTAPDGEELFIDSQKDTISEETDSLPDRNIFADRESLDTARGSITKIRYDRVDIDNVVHFSAKDSLVLVGQNNAFLYGNSVVDYSEFKVNADEIRMEMDSSTVYAAGVIDSTGKMIGNPVFKDKGGEYESKTMKYNFKTERGFITDVITEQQDGYLTGGRAKKMEDGSFYVEDGRYTTCDDHENPHFYFQLTRAKVRPKKDVVTGPGYMVLMGIPLPLALPFGYFPFSEKYSSGVIFPSFGDDYNRGFYLRDGGYYFAINDNVDLALRGEIYTKGSWGITGHSSYVKSYKFRGSFDISFLQTITAFNLLKKPLYMF